jgi:hypothetical protein
MEDLYSDLFTFGQCGEPLCLDLESDVHGQHFNPSIVQGENNLLAFVTGSVGASLGSLPFAAASGGVTFRFEDGVPVPTSISPGPIFAERAQTLGQGRAVVGMNVNSISLNSIRGVRLDELRFSFTHQNVGDPVMGDPIWENDVIEVDLNLSVDLVVAAVFASYGLTDALDLSIQVPMVRSSLAGTSSARIVHWQEGSPHQFLSPAGVPVSTAEARASGTAVGLGDIALRMKTALVATETGGLSLLGDLRLPTGSARDFHGTGSTSFRVVGAASRQIGDFTPHVNLGLVARGGWNERNSVLAIVGFDQMLSESITLGVELVGDFQVEDSSLALPAPVRISVPVVRTVEVTNLPDRSDDLLDIGFGLKFALPGDARVVTSALIPFLEGGARPSFMWTLGLERSF